MRKLFVVPALALGLAVIVAGCGTPQRQEDEVQGALKKFRSKDPSLKRFFDDSAGYVIFPDVGKGGIGIGGAYGTGEVYEGGKFIGRASITQASIGFQLGGQSFRELIFLKDKKALNEFKLGSYEFDATLSAVAVKAGAATTADYSKGVAVFTMTKGGLMYEASVGGQKFKYYAGKGG